MKADEANDRTAIDAVLNSYTVGIDRLLSVFPVRLDPAELAAVFDHFAVDGVLQSPFARTEGRTAIREAWARVATLDPPADGPRYCRHHLTSRETVMVDPTTARSTVYLQAVTDRGLDHWGYNDFRMTKTAGEWKIAEHVVTIQDWVPGGYYDGLPHPQNVARRA